MRNVFTFRKQYQNKIKLNKYYKIIDGLKAQNDAKMSTWNHMLDHKYLFGKGMQ